MGYFGNILGYFHGKPFQPWMNPHSRMDPNPRGFGGTQISGNCWTPRPPRAFPTPKTLGSASRKFREVPTGLPRPSGILWGPHLELQLGSQEIILGWRLVQGPAGLWEKHGKKNGNSCGSGKSQLRKGRNSRKSAPCRPWEVDPGILVAPGFWEGGAGCSSPAPWPAPSPSGKCHCGEGTPG